MPHIHSDEECRNFGRWLVDVCDVVVATSCNNAVGFLALQGAEIQGLYVERKSRMAGLGAELLTYSKSTADRLELWTFQKNLRAQAFYKRHGFIEDARTDGQGNDEKLPDIHMVWTRKST